MSHIFLLASLPDFFLLGELGVLVMNNTCKEMNHDLVFIILLLLTIILVIVTDRVSVGKLLRHRFVGLSYYLESKER